MPRTGIGIGTPAPGQPLPLALLAMAAETVPGTGAVMGRRRPACVSHWGVRQRRSSHCRWRVPSCGSVAGNSSALDAGGGAAIDRRRQVVGVAAGMSLAGAVPTGSATIR
jgi:hypothetical protein